MRRNRTYKDPYSQEEIFILITEYDELHYLRSKAWVQVRLMDIDRALAHLRPKERGAVLLCGIIGVPMRQAAKLLGVPTMTAWRHYVRGMDNLARYLNGGT